MNDTKFKLCAEGWRLYDAFADGTGLTIREYIRYEDAKRAYFTHRRECPECTDPMEVEDE